MAGAGSSSGSTGEQYDGFAVEFRRAPFFSGDDQFMKRLEDISGEAIDAAEEPYVSVSPEYPYEEGVLIPPETVLRLAVDRGDFPYSDVDFDSYSGSPVYWEVWTDYVLNNEAHSRVLEKCGLIRMVEAFRKFKLEKDNVALIRLAARWSHETHTFVTSWGEFTITLEDVCELLGIRILGNTSFLEEEYAEEEQIVETLNSWYSSCYSYKGLGEGNPKKSNFAQWIKYVFRDMRGSRAEMRRGEYSESLDGPVLEHKYHVAGYIAALLSRFVAPGKPMECPRKCLFKLAARCFISGRPSVPALILGCVYHWLDKLHYDSICKFVNYRTLLLA